MYRSFSYKLRPSPAQAVRLGQWIGATRLVFNLCLEQRRDFWRQHAANTGSAISFAGQSREVSDLRREHAFIADVPRSVLTSALRDLDHAYRAFFTRGSGYPTPRKLGVNDSVRFEGRETQVRRLNAKWADAHLPKIGAVRLRLTRPLAGRVVEATVRRAADGWRLIVKTDIGPAPQANARPSVGIDRGIATTLSLSNGEHIRLPSMTLLEKQRRLAQRVMSRRKRGSARYAAQRRSAALISARLARIRSHHLHVASSGVAARFGIVGLEDLRIQNMSASASGQGVAQKRGLNRAIMAQGWGIFARQLAYKLEAAGGQLVYVPAAYTSQTCAECGVVDAGSRKSQAVFQCVACDHRDHADTNAARNIMRGSTALVEKGHLRPSDEARTSAAPSPKPASVGDAEPNTALSARASLVAISSMTEA